MAITSHNRTAAIIVAAGRGTRASTGQKEFPKQYQMIGNQSILARTLTIFAQSTHIDQILTVIHSSDTSLWQKTLEELTHTLPPNHMEKLTGAVHGGSTRQLSVFEGLKHLSDSPPRSVIIHDAVRPFFSEETIDSIASRISEETPALVAATPVVDTLKYVNENMEIKETRSRENLWQAQTPQGFLFCSLLEVHNKAMESGRDNFTDDAAIFEWAGLPVAITKGNRSNMKITSAEDLILADSQRKLDVFAETADIRVGTGFDVHAFGPGRNIVLGGVSIEHDCGLVGHSDSDIVLHTLTDAILGALAEGDIGEHFPPSDEKHRDADSSIFLRDACRRVDARKGIIAHLDATILCEVPKIGPHRNSIRESIAEICGISQNRVSIKATTTEKLGFTGRKEGIACIASATVRLPIQKEN